MHKIRCILYIPIVNLHRSVITSTSEIFHNSNWQEGSKHNYVGNSCMHRHPNLKHRLKAPNNASQRLGFQILIIILWF